MIDALTNVSPAKTVSVPMMASMVDAPTRRRVVENIPPLLLGLLKDAGKLPVVPRLPNPATLGYREPKLEDMVALRWVAAWDGRTRVDERGLREVVGVAAYRDVYDFHSASDVREVVYLAGSRRGVIDVFRWLRFDASIFSRRLIGSFDCDNAALAGVVKSLGGVQTRCVFEDGQACQA